VKHRPALYLALAVIGVLAGVGASFRHGWVPPRYSPLPALNLSVARPWFIDWRLAELRRDPALCARVLRPPHIVATSIADSPLQDGCGWTNGVRVASLGQVSIRLDKLTCETAAALAMWLEHEVQPAAQRVFGQPVTSIQHFGSYACRNIAGHASAPARRSEHALANAIDISGFTFADGRHITVIKGWNDAGLFARNDIGVTARKDAQDAAQFLRAVHQGACRYFRVALSPAFNSAHHDHFHLDRGPLQRCR
jgi:hypothetical protein